MWAHGSDLFLTRLTCGVNLGELVSRQFRDQREERPQSQRRKDEIGEASCKSNKKSGVVQIWTVRIPIELWERHIVNLVEFLKAGFFEFWIELNPFFNPTWGDSKRRQLAAYFGQIFAPLSGSWICNQSCDKSFSIFRFMKISIDQLIISFFGLADLLARGGWAGMFCLNRNHLILFNLTILGSFDSLRVSIDR